MSRTLGDRMRVLNPLEIKFSQQVIYPAFNDYRSIDDAITSIRERPVTGSAKYDVILHTKFPAITIIRWRPKLRDAEGNPILDTETGEQLYGEMAWFTLDNRRLHALQRACAERYPRRCGVEVFEIMSSPPLQMAKKFRTRSNGETVMLGTFQGLSRNNVVNANKLWDPRQAVFFVECAIKRSESDLFTVAKSDCALWQYQSMVNGVRETFGPFSTVQMRDWWQTEQLPSSLPIRRWTNPRGQFVPIDTFFGPTQPFDESVDEPDNISVPQVAKADPDRREANVVKANGGSNAASGEHLGHPIDTRGPPSPQNQCRQPKMLNTEVGNLRTTSNTLDDSDNALVGTTKKIHEETLNCTKMDIYETSSGARKEGNGTSDASQSDSYYKRNANSQDRQGRQPLDNEQTCSRVKPDSNEWQENDNSNNWSRSWHQATGSSANAWHVGEWKKHDSTGAVDKTGKTSLQVDDAARWSSNEWEKRDANGGTDKTSLQVDDSAQRSSNGWEKHDANGGADKTSLQVDDATQWSSNRWKKHDAIGGTDKTSLQVADSTQWSSNGWKKHDDQWGASWSKETDVISNKSNAPEKSWTSDWKTHWNTAWTDANAPAKPPGSGDRGYAEWDAIQQENVEENGDTMKEFSTEMRSRNSIADKAQVARVADPSFAGGGLETRNVSLPEELPVVDWAGAWDWNDNVRRG